jgi:hypothetical protein
LGKLKNEELDDQREVAFEVAPELLLICYPAWKKYGTLPHAGGVLDQPPAIMRALYDLDYIVAWYMQNEEKSDPNRIPDVSKVI